MCSQGIIISQEIYDSGLEGEEVKNNYMQMSKLSPRYHGICYGGPWMIYKGRKYSIPWHLGDITLISLPTFLPTTMISLCPIHT